MIIPQMFSKIFIKVPYVTPALYPSSRLSKAYLCCFDLCATQEHLHQTPQLEVTLSSGVRDGKSRLVHSKLKVLGIGLITSAC